MNTPQRPSKRRTGNQTTPAHRLRMPCHPCDKWAYSDKNHAKDERKRLRREDVPNWLPLSVYRCPANPAQWHIGHDYDRAEETRRYYLGHGVS